MIFIRLSHFEKEVRLFLVKNYYSINLATAAKGINILVDRGIVYKKRGIGIFVMSGAKESIKERRKLEFYDKYISSVIKEAKSLSIRKKL